MSRDMKRTAVINVAGLSESLLGPHTPRLNAFRRQGTLCRIMPAFPAVTCTAQANYLTGLTPAGHGVVGNGWYHRELAEVQFWKQSNRLVGGTRLWESLREGGSQVSCAKLFWWFNMYSSADWSITPRPLYLADGRKVFDIYAWPYSLRTDIKRDLGEFPFPAFWGPAAGRDTAQASADAASRWIADSAKWVERKFSPTLNLVYLPHLDYSLQRLGPQHPEIPKDLRRVDDIVGGLLDFFQQRSVQVVVLSEYGIAPVDTPIHLNRLFREQGWLALKDELGREALDCGHCRVFAVADHQVAHIYLNDPSLEGEVRALLQKQSGVAEPGAPPRSALPAWNIVARATSSRWPASGAGSHTIIGWTTSARPISRGAWTSTASRVMTRWNCSWIQPHRLLRRRSPGACCRSGLGCGC